MASSVNSHAILETNKATVVVLGLNVLSLSVSKLLMSNYHKKVILLSNNNINELIANEDLVHLIELNNLNSNKQLTDIYYTLNYLNPDDQTVKLIDNFEFYENKKQQDLIGLMLENNDVLPNCLNLKNETLILNPKSFISNLYQELVNLGPMHFNHFITPPQMTHLNDYINFIPNSKRIINFLINNDLKLIRNQSILVKLANNTQLTNSMIHKTNLNQFARLIPLLEDGNLILLNGPKQVNDYYSRPRDSDTLNLLYRSFEKFPKILENLEILQTKVVFKSCFDDQVGKIWVDKLDHDTEIINVLGFGFNEFDSIGGIVEYIRILLGDNKETRL